MAVKYFLANVYFKSPHVLAWLAARLSGTLGLELLFDQCGKYEEFPAFIAEGCGLELALLGMPEGDPTLQSELTVRANTELSFEAWQASLPGFFRDVFVDKEKNSRGYIDCSTELVRALVVEGFSDCSE
ncbi:hypothetical protein [Bordetella ansorpii]|uniref:hypothetical protein n=1 Tax=Bordetella ansorpii TaxID=288768 RepID=UPI0012E7A286|nr:hypothetical protein [Bordetella ansorpii]